MFSPHLTKVLLPLAMAYCLPFAIGALISPSNSTREPQVFIPFRTSQRNNNHHASFLPPSSARLHSIPPLPSSSQLSNQGPEAYDYPHLLDNPKLPSHGSIPNQRDRLSLSPQELHQYLVRKSRPKKKPVSFHATFSGISSGFFLSALMALFAPFKNGTVLFMVDTNLTSSTVHQMIVAGMMIAVTSILGYLRLAPNAPRVRRSFFRMSLFFNLYLASVLSSSLNQHPSMWLFDGFRVPGKIMLIGTAAMLWASSLELVDESITGPDRGRWSISAGDTRAMGFMLALSICLFTFAMTLPVIPPLLASSSGCFDSNVGNVLTSAGMNASFVSIIYTGLAQGAFGSALATFQFEKKVSRKQGRGLAFLLLFALNIDAVLFTMRTLSPNGTGTAAAARVATDYFISVMKNCHYMGIFWAVTGGTVINALRRRC